MEQVPPAKPSKSLIGDTLTRIEDHEHYRCRWRRRAGRSIGALAAAAVLILGITHLYFLNLEPSSYDLQVLGKQALHSGSQASVRVRLAHHETGQPRADAPIRLYLTRQETGDKIRLAQARTNAQGTAGPCFELPDWPAGKCELEVVAESDDTLQLQRTVELRRSWRLMLSTGKPVYQPGQTIKVRSLALRKPKHEPVAGRSATFTIAEPEGNVIYKHETVTSKYGITSAQCELADTIRHGDYTIRCKIGDSESKRTVEVKHYTLPAFKIQASVNKPFYQPGQTMRGKVSADYLFGKPVADGRVKLHVHSSDPSRGGRSPTARSS
jgi:5-hydroxyisourate hydrolase-like protein (transthyretin family)